MDKIQPFSGQQLEMICKVLGATDGGLTGSEIGQLLTSVPIPDTDPGITKWQRLYNAFAHFQNKRQFGNHIIVFITRAMDPVRYVGKKAVFETRIQALNEVLAFLGYYLNEQGQVCRTTRATTLQEATRRASRLKATLDSRQVHRDVLSHCNAELIQQNYFHAVLEAMKSIATKIKKLSGLSSDGADLVRAAFELGKTKAPMLAINPLATDSDESEQKGFVNLLIGLFGMVRNPTAHAPKIEWDINEQDALDLLTTISLIHRKLDRAVVYAPKAGVAATTP